MKSLFAATGITVLAGIAAGQTSANHGISKGDMDPSASACQNFFQYADGGWLSRNPVPAAYSRWGSFIVLAEQNRETLRSILEEAAADRAAAEGSDRRKIGDFYATCMDEARAESEGNRSLQPDLDRIAKITDGKSLDAEVARLQEEGVNVLFGFSSQQDRKNSDVVIASASQGGLGLPDRDYYLKTDDKSKDIREKYSAHVQRMLEILGDAPDAARTEAAAILGLETKLAEASMTRVERRDPDATYHPMTVEALETLSPGFAWKAYLQDVASPKIGKINVSQPKFFEAVSRELRATPIPTWRSYLRWRLLDATAATLSSKFVQEDFDFNGGVLQGKKENLPRWKRCVSATDTSIGFALGRLYVAKTFPPEAKERADRMVKNLIAALRDDLQTLSWMGDATKKAALAKLDAFTPKIGYPDEDRDYSAYHLGRDSYAANFLAGNRFEFHRTLDKIGKPVDRKEWGMTPPTVNAYYNSLKNEIVFPAGILRPPFFDAQADDAVNYGAIGAVIGHEMTHGFDDQGRKFDAKGNLTNWWTDADLKNYEARSACVEKQFDAYVAVDDLHENGKLVLGESIADLGGLAIAYRAFRKSLEGKPEPAPIDGLTADQRFFLGYARVWAENDRPEYLRLKVATDPHPVDRIRAFAAPSNLPEFARAFSCKAGDAMVRPEEARCQIW
jgi:predicted metalloendopeptidase